MSKQTWSISHLQHYLLAIYQELEYIISHSLFCPHALLFLYKDCTPKSLSSTLVKSKNTEMGPICVRKLAIYYHLLLWNTLFNRYFNILTHQEKVYLAPCAQHIQTLYSRLYLPNREKNKHSSCFPGWDLFRKKTKQVIILCWVTRNGQDVICF